MYLNKIDELIDKVIDDFYTIVITGNKVFRKILNDMNFIKHQHDINEMIGDYIKGIPEENLSEITKKRDSIDDLFDILKRYSMIYMFLTFGAHYGDDTDNRFINNIIEFSKNQSQYSLRINDFFNSASNADVIRLSYIVTNIQKLLDRDKPEIQFDKIRKQPYAKDTVDFFKMDEMSDEFINNYLRNSDIPKDDRLHNIIKTVMILLIYRTKDKKRLYTVIEQTDKTDGEYIFIDVVEPITNQISFMTVESLISKEDAITGLAHDLWDYMQREKEYEFGLDNDAYIGNDEMISRLINSGLVIPILDDFLLYHRDTERYEFSNENVPKKKEDTKIRYIIGKIDTTAEFYSDAAKKDEKLKDLIKNNFSVPLYDKKAILKNDIEDINIINKFLNQGKRNQTNDDYFNDLMYFRRYAYINFKDFDRYGFAHSFTKTVTAIRSVSFDTTTEFRQTNANHKLQRRVGSKGSIGNIVGFMIPPNAKSLQCLQVSDIINVKSIGKKNKNGYELFLNQIKHTMIKENENGKAIYWLFDLDTDSVSSSTFETSTMITSQDTIKAMVASLYKDIVNQIYYEIIDKIDMVPDITPETAYKIVSHMERNIIRAQFDRPTKIKIKDHIFKRYQIDKDVHNDEHNYKHDYDYDYDDTIYGIEGNVIELPEYNNISKATSNEAIIELAELEVTGEKLIVEAVEGLCQHNITWDNIIAIRRREQMKYMEDMYNFIQQYVIEDTNGDLVCKSCGYQIDIARYIQEGKFDESTQKFVTFSMPMDVDIVDLPEYHKLDFAIKIMDKNIDKICSSVGITYFVGNSYPTKWRRRGIVKKTIDMVKENNTLLSKTFKQRNEKKESEYGISKNLSTLFIFDMENNIYMSSSKDKDQEQFKMIKRNNIITYIMIFLVLELNESQITFFAADQKSLCDIRIFDKIYDSLFKGLRIKKNNTDDTVPITNYKVLCYAIYMISCRVAKHRLWYASQSMEKNIIKMIPIIQRFIVHTFVDILNSILENSFKNDVSYIFEIFRVRFYSKLTELYSDNLFYDIILAQSSEQYAISKRRIVTDMSKISQKRPFTFMEPIWRSVVPQRYFMRYKKPRRINLYDVSNLTNCPSGEYHDWTINTKKGSNFICRLCNTIMADNKYDAEKSRKIVEKFKINIMNRIALKFCLVDGQFHQYVYDVNKDKNICIKCNNSDTNVYGESDLDNLAKILNDQKTEKLSKKLILNETYNDEDKKNSEYIDSVVKKNLKELELSATNENPLMFIDTFIDTLRRISGDEIKGKFPIHLNYNIYIIDHNHHGHKLDGGDIVIRESDKKINVKSDHPHFKTDVLYYTDYSTGRIDVFYDTVSRTLLGYKEESKDYIDIKNSDKKIRINYSTSNKLKLMGFTAQYINIADTYSHLAEKYDGKSIDDRQPMYRVIIANMCRTRLANLDNIILKFQTIMNRIINQYMPDKHIAHNDEGKDRRKEKEFLRAKKSESSIIPYVVVTANSYASENLTYFADKLDDLYGLYVNRISKINIVDASGKHKAFKHWKAISRGIVAREKNDIYLNTASDVIDSYTVGRYDNESHQVLHYIVTEFTKLISYNDASFMKSSIVNFLVEFIDRVFFEYNNEHLMANSDVKRFMAIITSPRYIREISEETEYAIKKEGMYDEVVDDDIEITEEMIENQIDIEEEFDALDVEEEEEEDLEEGFSSRFDRNYEMAYQ